MPESSSMKQKHQRPTSDIILETGRKLLTEVEKSAVMDSNKHVSMLLARSRSLDIVSSPSSTIGKRNSSEFASKSGNENNNSLSSASPAEERDCEQLNMYVSNSSFAPSPDSAASSENNNDRSVKDKSSLINYATDKTFAHKSTLLKDKSEYNNNSTCDSINFNESYRSSANRCSSSSTSTTSSSNSGKEKSAKPKSKRMSLSTLEGGAAFQEVVLKSEPIRITGYLEKRSKVLGWKKFWFVLDGRLLTYYKSKADYESLSACCGCINLGIATSVRPIQIRGCKGYPLQIVTRSQVYYLRSQEKPVLEQWLIAIQEAASSPSASALASWNSGSQYLRHSFNSQSQWSLDNSTDDISNITDRLGNLPDTFYQQRDRGSLACLSNPSSQVSPVIQKYHSFASLQAPILNDTEDRRKILLSSTENLRDLQYSKGKPVRNSISTMQHSTSLLVLDSSPQAAELRKELTRKLSIGSSKQSNGDDVAGDDDGSVPSAKFLLLTAKNKLQLGPSGENESHDYAEIGEFMEVKKTHKPYENCDVEDTSCGKSKAKIITSANQNIIRGDSCEKDGNIYEHIETSDSISNGAAPGSVIWEPLNEGNNTVANNKRFPMHRINASSNRNSLVSISELPEDLSSLTPSPIKTPVLTSIPETSWRSGVEPFKKYNTNYSEDDMSSCRSESFRSLPCVEKSGKKKKGKAFTGFLSKMFGKNKGKSNKAESLENLQRSMVISGPVDLRNQEMKETKPDIIPERTRQPINKNNSSETGSRKNSCDQQDPKASPLMAGSRMTINNTFVMDELKQKVGHITLKRTQSKEITRDRDRDPESPKIEPVQVQSSNASNVISRENSMKAKQEPRVPYVPRSIINESIKQTPVLVFPTHNKSHESNTDDECFAPLNEQENETQIASICLSPEMETPFPEIETPCPEIEDNTIHSGNIQLNESPVKTEVTPPQQPRTGNKNNSNTDVDFQNKLAKFNRLSQRLSESFFIAAATSPQVQNNHNIGRSHSCKANRNKGKADDDVIPPLPPKKKNSGSSSVSIYDVPLNNKPVNSSLAKLSSQKSLQQNEENSIAAFIRGITKKNSTPDIVISGNNAKIFGLRDVVNDPNEFRKALNSNSDDNFDVYKSSPSLPPPRPPKPKPNAKPKSFESGLSRSTANSESSLNSETIIHQPIFIPQPPPMQVLLQPPADISPTSSKSMDIDVLDGLSDIGLSDTKASNSPTDSPQVCPLHPVLSRDDLSLSTLARTPDSLMTISDRVATDSLASTPNTEIFQSSDTPTFEQEIVQCPGIPETVDPISINKLEIVIRNNDASPGLILKSPDTESRMDSLERNPTCNATSITPINTEPQAYENIKFATVNTLIQEFETVQENEEMSELYDDFPAEFYTPTPSVFSGYSSEISSTSTDSPVSSSSNSQPPSVQSHSAKKHARIDAIRNSGMEQLEAFLSFGSTTSSDDCSFESCVDSFSEDVTSTSNTVVPNAITVNNNNISKTAGQQGPTSSGINNRTGAISRLGHSSAIGHLQKILTSDVK